MNKRFKLVVLVLVIVLLISSMSVLLTSCNTPKYYASLEQAYAEGKISRQDLMSSAYYNCDENDYSEDFVPTPKNPKELDEKTQEKIIDMFLNEEGLGENDNAGLPYKNYIDLFYLGTYDNIIICAIVIDTLAQDYDSIEIDGILFGGPGGLRLIAIELW